jgi:TolB protein
VPLPSVSERPEPAAKPNESYAINSEENLGAVPASREASTSKSKRTIAIAVALLIVVAGVGLVFWGLSNGSRKNSAKENTADGKARVTAPLKLERLTGTGESTLAAISADGKYIAYTRNFEKRSSIWLRQLATNTNVEIVPLGGTVYGLAFTNSNESLYFVRRDGEAALYRVALLGGLAKKIVDKLEGNFSISADDSKIAFIRKVLKRDGQPEYSLVIADSSGADERTLSTQPYPHALDVPVWSPDNKSIICSSGSSNAGGQEISIVEVRLADGTRNEWSSERFFHIRKMAWLPDKSGLIISASKRIDEHRQLWRVSYPGRDFSRITESFSAYVDLSIASGTDKAVATQATRISDIWVGEGRGPRNLKKITQAIDDLCWTPGGRLVYSSMASGNAELWIMQPDGTEQRQLTNDGAHHDAPAVTSDNRYIVFVSNRTGALQVWRMNMDGGNQIRLTDGAGKSYPAISPDGKWVVYNTNDDWHLWKVPIDGGQPSQLTAYLASHPCVSPDGRMIACVGGNESKRELLILPFEGGEPLRRLDFRAWSSRLQWADDGKAIIYVADRNGTQVIVKQSLEGGRPEEIVNFAEGELFDFGYSYDSRYLAVTRGGWQHDIVLIENLL